MTTTSPIPGGRARTARRTAAVAGAAVLLVAASACGTANNNPSTSAQTNTSGEGVQGAPNGQQGFPGADGTVAAVSGSTAQVQNPQTGQVAVSWTASTRFTKQVSASLSAVKTGECVMVSPTQTSTRPGSGTTQPTAITAATVRISEPVSGSCSAFGRGGPGGGRPSFSQGGDGGTFPPPSGAPSGFPSGGPGGGRTLRAFGAFGTVTAVSGTGFTVRSALPSGIGGSSGSSSIAVTVNRSTTYSTDATGKASDVKVGVCLRAQGSTDSTGAVTARTVAISQPVGGQCSTGIFQAGGPGAGPIVQGS